VAFPPLLWLIGAVVSVLVHFFFDSDFAGTPGDDSWDCLSPGRPFVGVAGVIHHSRGGNTCQSAKPTLVIVRVDLIGSLGTRCIWRCVWCRRGIGFLLNDWLTLLFVVPFALILHFGVILPDERYLEAKFGEQYLALKRKVRRWI
jgi:uncharacterized membrane protein YhaH (DUF805 family)